MLHKLAVITVIYENYNIISDFIDSFKKQTYQNFSIFLSDLSQNKKNLNLPKFAAVTSGQNKGYAHGVNLGLKKAIDMGFSQFVIINDDTRINKDFTQKAINSLQSKPNSIIGGKIYYEKNFEYHKDRYQKEVLGKVFWYAGGIVDWKNAYTLHRGVDEIDHGQYDKEGKTGFITGCLMCFDKKVIDTLGFWDESYFLYFEDADYCERAKKRNINLYYDPSIIIWHKNAQSTEGSGSNLHQKFQNKNRLKFGLKYAPLRTKLYLIKNNFLVMLNSFQHLDEIPKRVRNDK